MLNAQKAREHFDALKKEPFDNVVGGFLLVAQIATQTWHLGDLAIMIQAGHVFMAMAMGDADAAAMLTRVSVRVAEKTQKAVNEPRIVTPGNGTVH